MTGLRSPWLLAVAPALFCLTPVLVPFISLRHRFLYHQDGSALIVLSALWVNLLVAWLIFVALLLLAARWRRLALLFWVAFLAYLPLVLLRNWAALNYTNVPPAARRTALLLSAAFLVAVVLLWRPLLRSRSAVLLSHVEALFGFLSLGWFVTLAQLAYYTVEARHLDRPPVLHQAPPVQATAAAPRVVWILMDELGYDPVFAHRFPGVTLPAFDALAAQSTQFTQARAPGLYTEFVVPEIIMGHAASHIAFTPAGAFTYVGPTGERTSLNPEDTLFGDALRAGYSTAVVGWHNPYCRLLGTVLDRCLWRAFDDSQTPDFDVNASLKSNLEGPARHIWANLHVPPDFQRRSEQHEAGLHIRDVQELIAAADQTLSDPRLTCVLIHLPVPHPTGIWDRRSHAFTTSGKSSYVDNLVLADEVLAHLRAELTTQGAWESSTILVMGDHSWRTTMQWKPLRGWTTEDELASRGSYDPRPAFLVKLPGQQTPASWDRPFPTLNTRALFNAVFRHEVRTPDDLQRWAAAH